MLLSEGIILDGQHSALTRMDVARKWLSDRCSDSLAVHLLTKRHVATQYFWLPVIQAARGSFDDESFLDADIKSLQIVRLQGKVHRLCTQQTR